VLLVDQRRGVDDDQLEHQRDGDPRAEEVGDVDQRQHEDRLQVALLPAGGPQRQPEKRHERRGRERVPVDRDPGPVDPARDRGDAVDRDDDVEDHEQPRIDGRRARQQLRDGGGQRADQPQHPRGDADEDPLVVEVVPGAEPDHPLSGRLRAAAT
jgi:hypothetical protein